MEVWALEGYGAANVLQEMLTVKSDDIRGRDKTYERIVKGQSLVKPGVPESFRVLVKELQGLGLDVEVQYDDGSVGGMTLDDDEDERGAYAAAASTVFDEDAPGPGDARPDDSEDQGDIFDIPDTFMEEKEALAEGLSLIEDAAEAVDVAGDEEGD